MTSVATTVAAVTPAVAITVGRAFESRIQPTALKADADNGPSGQKGDKAQRNQDHGQVHTISPIVRSNGVARDCGPLVAHRKGDMA